jgi:hypothetical protein
MARFAIVFLIAVWPGVCAMSAQTQPQEFRVSLASSQVVVDGRLEEAAWQQAVPNPARYEFFPGDNTPSAVETDRTFFMKVSYAWVR